MNLFFPLRFLLLLRLSIKYSYFFCRFLRLHVLLENKKVCLLLKSSNRVIKGCQNVTWLLMGVVLMHSRRCCLSSFRNAIQDWGAREKHCNWMMSKLRKKITISLKMLPKIYPVLLPSSYRYFSVLIQIISFWVPLFLWWLPLSKWSSVLFFPIFWVVG